MNTCILQGVREAEAYRAIPKRVQAGIDMLDVHAVAWLPILRAQSHAIDVEHCDFNPLAIVRASYAATCLRDRVVDMTSAQALGLLPVAELGTHQWEVERRALNHEWRVRIEQLTQEGTRSGQT